MDEFFSASERAWTTFFKLQQNETDHACQEHAFEDLTTQMRSFAQSHQATAAYYSAELISDPDSRRATTAGLIGLASDLGWQNINQMVFEMTDSHRLDIVVYGIAGDTASPVRTHLKHGTAVNHVVALTKAFVNATPATFDFRNGAVNLLPRK